MSFSWWYEGGVVKLESQIGRLELSSSWTASAGINYCGFTGRKVTQAGPV